MVGEIIIMEIINIVGLVVLLLASLWIWSDTNK